MAGGVTPRFTGRAKPTGGRRTTASQRTEGKPGAEAKDAEVAHEKPAETHPAIQDKQWLLSDTIHKGEFGITVLRDSADNSANALHMIKLTRNYTEQGEPSYRYRSYSAHWIDGWGAMRHVVNYTAQERIEIPGPTVQRTSHYQIVAKGNPTDKNIIALIENLYKPTNWNSAPDVPVSVTDGSLTIGDAIDQLEQYKNLLDYGKRTYGRIISSKEDLNKYLEWESVSKWAGTDEKLTALPKTTDYNEQQKKNNKGADASDVLAPHNFAVAAVDAAVEPHSGLNVARVHVATNGRANS